MTSDTANLFNNGNMEVRNSVSGTERDDDGNVIHRIVRAAAARKETLESQREAVFERREVLH